MPSEKSILIRSHTAMRRTELSGGATRLMRNIATALVDSGWTVEILSPRSHEEGTVGTPAVRYVEFEYGDPSTPVETVMNMFRGIQTYRKLVNHREFDVILDDISHYPYYPAHYLCPEGTTNAVFMHTAFFGAAREYVGLVRGTVVDMIDRTLPWLNQPKIICAGESTRRRIHEKTGYQRTEVLHPMVRTEEFEYSFDPNSRTILYLGRLDARKNVECLLRAWQRVEQSSEKELTLLIAGTGPREQALHALANRLSLSQIEFLGYVDESRKRQLFSDALLYIIPSKMEGYVTTGIEALAGGTPVVGSDTYGINDYIRDGETGYLFPVDDYERLSQILIELTDDPKRLQSVAEAGRELAEQHSYEAFRQKADRVFSSIV